MSILMALLVNEQDRSGQSGRTYLKSAGFVAGVVCGKKASGSLGSKYESK